MRKTTLAFFTFFFLLTSLIIFQIPAVADDNTGNVPPQVTLPESLIPQLSVDGKTLFNGIPLKAVINDPEPSTTLRRIPAPDGLMAQPEAATSSFSITYIPNGGSDLWGEACYTFPEGAKTAFNAAANIWANTLKSSEPITIKACWGNLGSSSILGYSGGGPLRRDFSGATRSNTWYSGSLANALNGSDLDPGNFDMHITYNSNFSWYYGTDGNTPLTQHDLMSVVLHEIAHGLNFSGSMTYASGIGSWGYNYPPLYPNIYDVFMRNGSGTQLINYTNGSTALGSALVSNNIWFHGSQAMVANGNQRVKMYAPSTWRGGSSYSHLDYTTFNNTPNQLMVYAISAGESIHDPGVITRGLLQDLGWSTSASNITLTPLYLLLLKASSSPILNGDFESGAVSWTEYSLQGWDLIGQWVTSHSGTWSTWLGGGDNEIAYIQQQITVPSSSPYLAFYHWISSVDSLCGSFFDNGFVRINGTTVDSVQLCATANTGGWVKRVVDLSAYAGQTVMLQIRAETDMVETSSWYIDDVSFQASASAAAGLELEAVSLKVDSASQFKTKKDFMKLR